jgi:D-beta-D-heptose 7-phosphate kinase/D-beta-D-heptose 1-phosphate adenosyltransferase
MKQDYPRLIKKFETKTILVIGDIIADTYLYGDCTRVAPEAGIPVIDLSEKKTCLGGAANTAANLSAMGAKVLLAGLTGLDAGKDQVVELLQSFGIDDKYVVSCRDRSTLVKTRVSSASGTIVRFDEGSTAMVSGANQLKLINKITAAHQICDAIVIADYGKGVVTDEVIAALTTLQENNRKYLAVDSKNLEKYARLNPDFVKPNYKELLELMKFSSCADRLNQVKNSGPEICGKTNAKITAVSLDKDGAVFLQDGKLLCKASGIPLQSPSVSGGGDTFVSGAVLSLICGAKPQMALEIAMTAALNAIQKVHTATCTKAELLHQYQHKEKLLNVGLEELCTYYRAQNKRIVFTNGCFDVLHSGHVRYLKGAKKRGDVLIVGLNNDESIKRLKGLSRPINTLKNRIAVLSELSCIDHIISYGHPTDDTPIELIRRIKPDVFVKGADYKGKFMPEMALLKSLNTKVVLLPLVANQSSTTIISKIRSAEATLDNKPYVQ